MKKLMTAAAAVASVALGGGAFAATQTFTADQAITAKVLGACTISAPAISVSTTLVSGTTLTTAVTKDGTLAVACNNVAFRLGLDGGQHLNGLQRRMADLNGNFLPYTYVRKADALAIGTNNILGTVSGTPYPADSVNYPAAASSSIPMTASIAAGTTLPAGGDYSDTVRWYVEVD